MDCYLDTVIRLDGAYGFIIAQHPDYNIYCVKWIDEDDPRYTSPDLIIDWFPGTGIDRNVWMLMAMEEREAEDRKPVRAV